MDNDDLPIGRILGRREVLALFGVSGAALLAGCVPGQFDSSQRTSDSAPATSGATTTPSSRAAQASSTISVASVAPAATSSLCVATPAETEGPYFVNEMLNRSDIRSDPSDGSTRPGVPLQLTFNVMQVGSAACAPLAGAAVDIWHCDALGVYSDVRAENSVGKKFLRGYQVTDANGVVRFTTIYPGWYTGRAVHIHFMVRTAPTANTGSLLTSQLYFDDALTDQVHAQAPYASKGKRDTPNGRDGIYASGGDQLLLTPIKSADGYTATFNIGLKTT